MNQREGEKIKILHCTTEKKVLWKREKWKEKNGAGSQGERERERERERKGERKRINGTRN